MNRSAPELALDIDLSDPGTLPAEAIEQATALLQSGRLGLRPVNRCW
jgi:hypothetical protein